MARAWEAVDAAAEVAASADGTNKARRFGELFVMQAIALLGLSRWARTRCQSVTFPE